MRKAFAGGERARGGGAERRQEGPLGGTLRRRDMVTVQSREDSKGEVGKRPLDFLPGQEVQGRDDQTEMPNARPQAALGAPGCAHWDPSHIRGNAGHLPPTAERGCI